MKFTCLIKPSGTMSGQGVSSPDLREREREREFGAFICFQINATKYHRVLKNNL